MTTQSAAELLRAADPDRFGASLTAPVDRRDGLFALYALNIEVARAPFQSAEPMLAEMRLQWWIDRLTEMGQGTPPPQHEVLSPLWASFGDKSGALTRLAEARRRDCLREPFASVSDVMGYIDETAGCLMTQAARCLGADEGVRTIISTQAQGAGLVAWLRALPQLQVLGLGLADTRAEMVGELAALARKSFASAAKSRKKVPPDLAAALYPGAGIRQTLRAAEDQSLDFFRQSSAPSLFARRASLAAFALTGRWWRQV